MCLVKAEESKFELDTHLKDPSMKLSYDYFQKKLMQLNLKFDLILSFHTTCNQAQAKLTQP